MCAVTPHPIAPAIGVPGLEVGHLRRHFITHTHSDHTFEYQDFILDPAVLDPAVFDPAVFDPAVFDPAVFDPAVFEMNAPLQVFGPPGLRRMADRVLKAYSADPDIRLPALYPSLHAGYKVYVQEGKHCVIYRP